MPNPTTSVLDDFNRANETPLSGGGNWGGLGSAPQTRLVSNAAQGNAVDPSSDSMWLPTTFNADQEAFITVIAFPPVLSGSVGVWCRAAGSGSNNTGYLARLYSNAPCVNSSPFLPILGIGGSGTSFPGTIQLTRVLNSTAQRNTNICTDFTGIDRIWLNCIGDQIVVYHDYNGTGYVEKIRWTDAVYSGSGMIGLYFDRPESRGDSFGGGNV